MAYNPLAYGEYLKEETHIPNVDLLQGYKCKLCDILLKSNYDYRVHIQNKTHSMKYLMELSCGGPQYFYNKYGNPPFPDPVSQSPADWSPSLEKAANVRTDIKQDPFFIYAIRCGIYTKFFCKGCSIQFDGWLEYRGHLLTEEHREKSYFRLMQIGEERYREIHYDVPSLAQEKLFGKARSCIFIDRSGGKTDDAKDNTAQNSSQKHRNKKESSQHHQGPHKILMTGLPIHVSILTLNNMIADLNIDEDNIREIIIDRSDPSSVEGIIKLSSWENCVKVINEFNNVTLSDCSVPVSVEFLKEKTFVEEDSKRNMSYNKIPVKQTKKHSKPKEMYGEHNSKLKSDKFIQKLTVPNKKITAESHTCAYLSFPTDEKKLIKSEKPSDALWKQNKQLPERQVLLKIKGAENKHIGDKHMSVSQEYREQLIDKFKSKEEELQKQTAEVEMERSKLSLQAKMLRDEKSTIQRKRKITSNEKTEFTIDTQGDTSKMYHTETQNRHFDKFSNLWNEKYQLSHVRFDEAREEEIKYLVDRVIELSGVPMEILPAILDDFARISTKCLQPLLMMDPVLLRNFVDVETEALRLMSVSMPDVAALLRDLDVDIFKKVIRALGIPAFTVMAQTFSASPALLSHVKAYVLLILNETQQNENH